MRFRLIVLLRTYVKVGQIALRCGVIRIELQRALQFHDCAVVLAIRRQHPAKLHVRAGVIRMQSHQLPQNAFSISEAMSPHVDVGQGCQRIPRRWINRGRLFVFLFGIGKMILLFKQGSRRKVWFRISRLQSGGLAVCFDCFVRLIGFDHTRK